jgi:FkbM family methyltransferase
LKTEILKKLVKNIQTGRTLSSKLKILEICILEFLQDQGPTILERYVDLLANGMIFETDVRFIIRTPNDFFIVSSLWEEGLQKTFAFREGMNFLDVGAHIGKYTLRASGEVGKEGKVISIEPNPDNFSLLLKNIELNGLTNCIPLNMAAYNRDAEIDLFFGMTPARGSVVENFGRGQCTVKARTLDSVLAEIGIERVDLIKIDVEGAEYEALKGLENTLKDKDPMLIIEIMKRDEEKVLKYLKSLAYKPTLIHAFLPFRGGLMFYQFKK